MMISNAQHLRFAAVIALMLLGCAYYLQIVDPCATDHRALLCPPSAQHWLGTDTLGRDNLARLLQGGLLSLIIGVSAAVIDVMIGILLGSVTMLGTAWDRVIGMLLNIAFAMPLLVVVALLSAWSCTSWWTTVLALTCVGWVPAAQLVRGLVSGALKQPNIVALRLLGISNRRILLMHLLPSLKQPLLAHLTAAVPKVIALESALSFLGLGIRPPMASLGSLYSYSLDHAQHAYWLTYPPLLILVLIQIVLIQLAQMAQDRAKVSL